MPYRIIAAVMAAAVLLAACDDGERPRLDDRGEARAGRPRKGGILRLGISQLPPNGLDPAQAKTLEQLLVADQLFDTLTSYDPETLEPAPGLAARWEVTPDQTQWDFHLRDGAAFANGRPIGAADVKYSLERVARKGVAPLNADLLEAVSGYFAFSVEGRAADLAGVTTPSPTVVRITTDEPFADLPSLLANPALGVVPREVVEKTDAPSFAEAPVGSGPFTYRGRRAGTISLVRAPGSPAYVDGIDLVQFSDTTDAYESFTDGDVDWARVPPQEVAAAGNRYGRALFQPYVGELFYAFNLGNPKYADVRFREAIVRAVDRRAITRAIYDDIVRPLDGVVVEGVAAHQDAPCGDRCEYDPARARELVREAFPDVPPPEVFLDFDDDDVQEKVANAMKSNLADVGITAVLRKHDKLEYQDFAVNEQREVFRLGWIGAYPSADAFLVPLFRSASPDNLSRLSVTAVDDQLRAARAEPDRDTRVDLYRQAERSIMEHIPLVPIAQFDVHAVASARVQGLEPMVTGSFDAARVWLAGS